MSSAASRGDVAATLAIVIGLCALVTARSVVRAFSKHPTRARCELIAARYEEQLARAEDKRLDQNGEHDPKLATWIDRCGELTEDEAICAEKSGYADELERCLP